MKYKLAVAAMALALVILAAGATLADKAIAAQGEGVSRYHQHISARQPDAGCDCSGTELCSHLPLVIIDTKGQEIPGAPTGERDKYGEELYALSADGLDTIDVTVSIIDNDGRNNHFTDTPTVTTLSEFRIRGHASRHFEKSPYLLKFHDESGENRDISVMGMDPHHEWVLYGPYLDKSLVRNYLWYNLAGSIMSYAPNVRYCEVILNGDYRGLYLMVETIAAGENSRLKLRETVKDTEMTGYLLRADRPTEEDEAALRNIYSFSERMFYVQEDLSLRYPGSSRLTPELAEEIALDFSAFEKALYSYDYDTVEYGYWNWIDVDSFVDYFLINELSRNVDAGRYSTYIYKEVDGKLKMCVWDFNNTCDNFPDDVIPPEGFTLVERTWYEMLFRDEDFVQQVLGRYEQLKDTYFSEEYLFDYIDDTLAYLGPALERNNARWADAMENWEPLIPAERNSRSQEEAVAQLKDWLHRRIEWMDSSIHILQEYSHPSRNKLYNH